MNEYRDWGWGYDMMMGGGWLIGLIMLFFGLLVLAGLVLLVIWAVRSSSGHRGAPGTAPTYSAGGQDEAVTIARRRYAAGEITKEQYEDMVRTLDGPGLRPPANPGTP